jgi:hypothetical protein
MTFVRPPVEPLVPTRELRWEYRITGRMDQGRLNALGRDGWELIAATQGDWRTDNITLYWKRRL